MDQQTQSPIAFFDISKQTAAIRSELMEAAAQVIDSGAFILGPTVAKFEQEFAQHTGAKNAISCASGSDALLLALMALEIGHGDEVILPSFTYYATASCVRRVGATPIFVDCDSTYNMNLDELDQRLSPNTRAIIPVHLFGQMVDMRRLQKWTASVPQKIYVIEDCAQSMGATYDERFAGCWGDIGAFSFYPTKNLGALGDGGLMTVQNPDIADKLRVLRVHGERKKYFHEILGINSRLDSIQAAFLSVKLKHLQQYEKAREAIANRYFERFEAAGISDFVTVPVLGDNRKHVWNQYTVRVRDRERLVTALKEQGIGSNIYYPLPLHLQKSFAYLGYKRGDLYTSEKLAAEVLSLPMYPELELDQVDQIVSAITNFYKK